MAKLDRYHEWIQDGELESVLAKIQSMAMQGKSVPEIAAEVGLRTRQFCRMQAKYPDVRKAVRTGRGTVVAMVQSKLMDRVKAGDTTAIIYSLKIYGGDFFNDRKAARKVEVSGPDEGPIVAKQQVVLYKPDLPDAEETPEPANQDESVEPVEPDEPEDLDEPVGLEDRDFQDDSDPDQPEVD